MSVELLRALPNDTNKLKHIFTKFGHKVYDFDVERILQDEVYLLLPRFPNIEHAQLLEIDRTEITALYRNTMNFLDTNVAEPFYEYRERKIYNYKVYNITYAFSQEDLSRVGLEDSIVYVCSTSVLKHILFSLTIFSIKANIEMILKKE